VWRFVGDGVGVRFFAPGTTPELPLRVATCREAQDGHRRAGAAGHLQVFGGFVVSGVGPRSVTVEVHDVDRRICNNRKRVVFLPEGGHSIMRQSSYDRPSADRALRWLLLTWGLGNSVVWWIHLSRRGSRAVETSPIQPGPFGEANWLDMGGFLAYSSAATLLIIAIWYVAARR